jgi:hypothetical protein
VLFLGFSSASIPTSKEGTLLVSPFLILHVNVPATGLSLTSTLVDDPIACGVALYLQALELDSGASKGVSFTPGLELVLGH